MPFTSLLDEIGAEEAVPDDLEDEADDAAEEDVGAEEPGLTDITPGGVVVPTSDFEEEPNEEQFEVLQEEPGIAEDLADPFTLAVEAPGLAGEDSFNFAVIDHAGEFNESPQTRLSGPSTPLSFDEDGIAFLTIGSTSGDVNMSIFGLEPADLGTIEVPEEAEAMAVEVENGSAMGVQSTSSGSTSMTPGVEGVEPGAEVGADGEFTEGPDDE